MLFFSGANKLSNVNDLKEIIEKLEIIFYQSFKLW